MTAKLEAYGRPFKWALVFSAAAHSLILMLIILNPDLPKPQPKGMIHYISTNFIGLPGGGGGEGGGGVKVAPQTELGLTEVQKETLRDLTTLEKLQQEEPKSSLHYPVDKPKKEPPKKAEKKAAITKPEASAKKAPSKGAVSGPGQKPGAGGGSGLTIGVGGPGTGEGSGGGFPGQLGISNFPYAYYIQDIQTKISSNWFQSLVDPGINEPLYVDVYFRIYKDGSISTVEIRESSGIDTLDRSAVRAVMQTRFPPLPATYHEDYLGIYLRFEHSK